MNFTINTSLPITFEKIEELEDPRFTRVKIYLCHTGLNLNKSYFSKESLENAIPSLSNVPILGFIEVDNLNQTDFKGHEQRLVIDEDGISVEYMGRAYGMIPSDNNARFEFKEDESGTEREYLVVEGLLWNKFKESIDIFDRDNQKPQSMELEPSTITGEFKDGIFHFDKFLWDGACILGTNVTPAMHGSIIEKVDFSLNNFAFQEMLAEFNHFYSKYANQSHNEVGNKDNQVEGGDNVDEKLELLAKFSTLQEDDIAEIKKNIEKYSLEDLEAKLNELVENQDKNKFTAGQLRQEISKSLSEMKYANDWGGESRAYWYIDHDANRVYAEDSQNGYLPVGMNYSLDGDFVKIDFESKKRVKFVPQDMEGEGEPSVSFMSLERKDFEVDQAKAEVEKQFETVQEELDKIKPEFETLKTEKEDLQSQVDAFSSKDTEKEIEKLNSKINDLAAYKAEREKQDKQEILDKFTQLSDEEKKPFVDELDKYSKEDLEDKLFAIVGRKGVSNFSKNKDNEHLMFGLTNMENSNSTEPAWTELVEQYKSKNK